MKAKNLTIIEKLSERKHPLTLGDITDEILPDIREAVNQLYTEGLIDYGRTINNKIVFWKKNEEINEN